MLGLPAFFPRESVERMIVRQIAQRVTADDRRAVRALMSWVERVIVQIQWDDLDLLMEAPTLPVSQDMFAVEAGGEMGGIWGSVVGPDTVSQIRLFALRDDWSVAETLSALLPPVRQTLRARGVTTLAYLGMEEWFVTGLKANGFEQTNVVITLHKGDFTIPDTGNPQVGIRPADEGDWVPILAVDQAAFEPLWRNTLLTLAQYRETCPFFVVAELDSQVVGYAHGSQTGRHGHLTRIAVHPSHSGGRIGARLLAEAITFFRRQRVFGITLNTQQDNLRARRLYERFGFRVLGREADVLVCRL